MRLLLKLFIFLLSFAGSALFPSVARGNDIYIAQNPAGGADGSSCANSMAATFFNAAGNWGAGKPIAPGTTVHLCGTFTGAPGTTALTFQGSGTSGSPITLLFEANAILQSPYWNFSYNGGGCGGAISMCGQSYITVDGGSNGVIQNTANGIQLANQKVTAGIDAFGCANGCTVKNLTIANLYVMVAFQPGTVDNTAVRAIAYSGSNWTVTNNTMHDCGWCVFDGYYPGDTNITIAYNNIYNFGHAVLFATNGANAASNLYFHDNQIHDAANWTTNNPNACVYHNDGIHVFGTQGSSINGIYAYNNYFYGDWGTCATGFIFVEANTSDANLSNSYWWNNVGIVPSVNAEENTNGWFGIFSGHSGTTQIFNNTLIGPNTTNNTICMAIGPVVNLYFQNNLISNCGDPVGIFSGSTYSKGNVDYNLYGPSCNNGNNCFIFNAQFTGSFSSWQGSCACDAHSTQSSNPLVNADGSLLAGSPAANKGVNLTSIATGNLATLSSDTTKGATRTPVKRSATGAWDIGAYSSSTATTLAPPTSLKAVSH
jgi:hypothetical protein